VCRPDDAVVHGDALDPGFRYEGTAVTCASGTLDGNTGTDSAAIADAAVAAMDRRLESGVDAAI
jgi:hypothetical protein